MPILPRFDLHALAADARRFAQAFPALAARLGRATTDPATERLVEGTTFLAGTVLDAIEGQLGSFHDLLAERASPWIRRALPSATVVALEPCLGTLSREMALVSAPLNGESCTFCPVRSYELTPCRVRTTSFESAPGRHPVLRITLEATTEAPINDAMRRGVSLFFDGDLENALTFVHALTTEVDHASATSADWPGPVSIAPARITREGLAADESIAPDPDGLPPAFGVITESLVFPDRFRFVEVRGLEACATAGPTSAVTLSFTLRGPLPPRVRIGPDDVRTNCATVTNLFDAHADPLPLDFELGAVPMRVAGLPARAGSVYAVRKVWATATSGEHGPRVVPDIRRLGAACFEPGSPAAFAAGVARGSSGAPVTTIAFARLPGADLGDVDRTVSASILATNGEHAGRLRAGDLAGALDIGGSSVRFRSIVAASAYIPPPLEDAFALRAVRLGGVSVGRANLLGALKDALFLAMPSWAGSPENQRSMHGRLDGVRAFDVEVARRAGSDRAVRHGYAYRVTLDESAFRGIGDISLFGATLGEALARSAPVNTFAELTVVGLKTGLNVRYGSRA